MEVRLTLAGDATAASRVAHRRGAGKIRHTETKTLRLQRHITERRVHLSKTLSKVNPADRGTKHLSQSEIDAHPETLGYRVATSRSTIALSRAGHLLEPSVASGGASERNSAR